MSKKIWITLPILIVKFSLNFWFKNLIRLFFRIKNLPFEFQDLSIHFLNLYTFLNPYLSCNLWFARNIGIPGFFDPCTYDVWSTEHLEFTFSSYLIFILYCIIVLIVEVPGTCHYQHLMCQAEFTFWLPVTYHYWHSMCRAFRIRILVTRQMSLVTFDVPRI